MPYLTAARDIRNIIAEYTKAKILWIDTEVADHNTRHPRLSLIQVLDDPNDMSGDRVWLLDILEQPDVVANFIEQIMSNPDIEKVFHNAKFDVKFLGGKQAKNITCTLELAKKIPYYLLPVPNYQLKTLATTLCNFHHIDKQEQISDWGKRPLTEEQIDYAYLDCIYLAQVHGRLLELQMKSNPEPETENLLELSAKYTEIEAQRKLLNSEFDHLQERIKQAMQTQNVSETSLLKLTSYERKTVKAQFTELVKLVQNQGLNLDFPITLTQQLQKNLGENLEQISVDIDTTNTWRIIVKNQEMSDEEE